MESSHAVILFHSCQGNQLNPGCHAKALIWFQVWALRPHRHIPTGRRNPAKAFTYESHGHMSSTHTWFQSWSGYVWSPNFEPPSNLPSWWFMFRMKSIALAWDTQTVRSSNTGLPSASLRVSVCAPRFFDPFASICKSQGPRISPEVIEPWEFEILAPKYEKSSGFQDHWSPCLFPFLQRLFDLHPYHWLRIVLVIEMERKHT